MLDFSPNHQLAEAVSAIAQKAGHAILEVYNKSADELAVNHKVDNSPVTEADYAANAIICSDLEKLDPQFPIVSEENKAIPFEERSAYDYYWLVDPLDGTKEFLKRNGEFTVNIALIRKDTPVFGVVYAPVPHELYVGYGDTAYVSKDGQKRQIGVSTFSSSDTGLTVVCSRTHINEATRAFMENLNNPETISVGSSLKFLMIASGRAHIYPRMSPTSEWDTAAAQAIVEAAGGSVLQYPSMKPVRYNKEILINPSFIVYGDRRD